MNERQIFDAAVEIEDLAGRNAYLDQACGGNPQLRASVEGLLRARDDAGSFLEHSPVARPAESDSHSSKDDPTILMTSGSAPATTTTDPALAFLKPTARAGSLGRLGQYEVLGIVGRGGMGLVLKAHDTKLDRMVAIKVLVGDLAGNPEARKRFLREAKAAAAVVHPHVVTIHAVEEEPVPYLVMELIDGQSLQDKLQKTGALGVKEILRIGSQIAAGLAAAHKQGLIHRDIKPANILLENGVERVKITDFGLARTTDDISITQSGQIAGTPQYMSPEQAQGQPIDRRSDLFSLGSVLYAMCTGRAAFRADSAMAVLRRVCDDAPRPIREVNEDIPEWLCGVVERLLAKNPAERFQSAPDVVDALEQKLAALQQHRASASLPVAKVQPVKANGWSPTAIVVTVFLCLMVLPILGIILMGSAWFLHHSTSVVPSKSISHPYDLDLDGTSLVTTAREPLQPAIAPFTAGEARAYQESWAKELGVPVEYTNSIGMKFRLIPPGEFVMGSMPVELEESLRNIQQNAPDNAAWHDCVRSEAPQHRVVLTKPFYLGIHEVTQKDYTTLIGMNPALFAATGAKPELVEKVANLDTQQFAVENVSWCDAADFCAKLSEREQLKPAYFRAQDTVTQLDGNGYRLPTEAEWEWACRAGTTTKYFNGDGGDNGLLPAGWFWSNADKRMHPVGELAANPFGLHDMHGNASEFVQDVWAADYYENLGNDSAVDPAGPPAGESERIDRVIRGGVWHSGASECRSASRFANDQRGQSEHVGFRVLLPIEAVQQSLKRQEGGHQIASAVVDSTKKKSDDATVPPPADAPFGSDEGQRHQLAWAKHLGMAVEETNAVGMKIRLIPPGKFMMGSTAEELASLAQELDQAGATVFDRFVAQSSGPRHSVVLQQPFYLSRFEVTVEQFQRFVEATGYQSTLLKAEPLRYTWKDFVGEADSSRQPVCGVSWEDAAAFCRWLTQLTGDQYDLPTEAQWEYSCRAGGEGLWSCGDQQGLLESCAIFGMSSAKLPAAVGLKLPNAFGLCDMHGNVDEWCRDWHQADYYGRSPLADPLCDETPRDAASGRVARGGAWNAAAWWARSATRTYDMPALPANPKGFRVVRLLP